MPCSRIVAAGLAGNGSSSYIDRVILRDRDHNSGWSSAADGTLEERANSKDGLLQNWRADVIGVILPNGGPQMYYRYDVYGEPIALHAGDIDGDGRCRRTCERSAPDANEGSCPA